MFRRTNAAGDCKIDRCILLSRSSLEFRRSLLSWRKAYIGKKIRLVISNTETTSIRRKTSCQLPDVWVLLDALELVVFVAVHLYLHFHSQNACCCPQLSFQADLLVTGYQKERQLIKVNNFIINQHFNLLPQQKGKQLLSKCQLYHISCDA